MPALDPHDDAACLRAARWAARRFRYGFAEFEDVRQDALVGLLRARAEPGSNAFLLMRREVCRALMEDHQRVRPSQDVWKAWKRFRDARDASPSLPDDALMERLGLSPDMRDCLRAWLVIMRPWMPLAGAAGLADRYRRPDPDAARAGRLAASMTGRPGEVVRRVYGLDGTPESRREFARRTGWSRLTVARAERKALTQLRNLMRSPRPGSAGNTAGRRDHHLPGR